MSTLKKDSIEFLSILEGNHQLLKGLHWNSGCKAEHLLTDDIDDAILEYEDKIAENVMGNGAFRIGVGELKTMLPSAKSLTDMLNELESDVKKFKATLVEDKHAGIINILDDLLTDINTWRYLKTFN
jgi:hypothetical protein